MSEDNETNEARDEATIKRVLATVMRRSSDERVDVPDDTLYAYVSGTSTPEQSALVVDAMSRSKAFREHVLAMAEEMERIESPAFATDFKAASVDPPPSYRSFLFRRRVSRWFSWVPAPHSPRAWAMAAVLVTVTLLGYPAYRGLVTLPGALESARATAASSQREVAGLRSELERKSTEVGESLRSAVTSTELFEPELVLVRGDQSPRPPVIANPNAALYVFGFAPRELSPKIPVGAEVVLELSDASGAVKSSRKLTAEDAEALNEQRQIGKTGLLTVAALADDMAPGRYRIVLKRTDAPSSSPYWEGEFELRRR